VSVTGPSQSGESSVRLSIPVAERDHIRGNADAPTTLVEYGDYECPYCGRSHPMVEEIRKRMGERLRFVFRHFPQNSVHPHAGHAAQAAEAAGAQQKFWEMHDMLFAHQADLAAEDIHRYALRLGLEFYKFEADLSSERFVPRVRADIESGQRSGVTRTPTFFINGTRFDGQRELEPLFAAIAAAKGQ
jgi:protein-disulfide isomerase